MNMDAYVFPKSQSPKPYHPLTPEATPNHNVHKVLPRYSVEWYRLSTAMRIFVQLLIAFIVLLGSVVLCAAGGGLIGSFIASRYPAYYRVVFSTAATQPEFDPSAMGIATGIGQGAAVGVAVGAIVVIALAIANYRHLSRRE